MRGIDLLMVFALAASPAGAQWIPNAGPLNGVEVVPPQPTPGLGSFQGIFDRGSANLQLTLTAAIAGQQVSEVHLHQGSSGSSGHPTPIASGSGGPIFFSLAAALSPAQVKALLASELYVDAHTVPTPPPALRGQIRLFVHLQPAGVSGSEVVPPTPSPGTAWGSFEFDPSTEKVSYDLQASGLIGSVTEAHVHAGAAGTTGPTVFTLTTAGPSTWLGTSPTLSQTEILDYLDEALYLDVHTTSYPNGEVRGPIEYSSLSSLAGSIAVGIGGVENLLLDAGPGNAGFLYLLLGSISGTSPGTSLGGLLVPLNVDPYFFYALQNPNAPPLGSSLGVLDATGGAFASVTIPAGSPPVLIGLTLHHAYVAASPLGELSLASVAVPLTFGP